MPVVVARDCHLLARRSPSATGLQSRSVLALTRLVRARIGMLYKVLPTAVFAWRAPITRRDLKAHRSAHQELSARRANQTSQARPQAVKRRPRRSKPRGSSLSNAAAFACASGACSLLRQIDRASTGGLGRLLAKQCGGVTNLEDVFTARQKPRPPASPLGTECSLRACWRFARRNHRQAMAARLRRKPTPTRLSAKAWPARGADATQYRHMGATSSMGVISAGDALGARRGPPRWTTCRCSTARRVLRAPRHGGSVPTSNRIFGTLGPRLSFVGIVPGGSPPHRTIWSGCLCMRVRLVSATEPLGVACRGRRRGRRLASQDAVSHGTYPASPRTTSMIDLARRTPTSITLGSF